MRGLRSVASLVGVVVGLSCVSSAAAAASKLAALVPQIRPAAAPELRDRFHEAVTRGLQTGGDEVLGAAEVRLRLGASEEMLGCAGTGPCVAHVAQTLHIDRVVASEVDVTGKDYAIKLRLLDAAGRELAKVDEPCDICTVKEADEAVARAATKLAAAAKSLPAETAPAATTEAPPPKAEVPPPKVEQPPPAVETPPAPVEPTPTPTHAEKKPFPWRPVAISSLAVGLVAIAIGIPLLAIDGQPTCSLPNPKTACPDVYNTVGGGATLLTLGIAGAAASGVLFYFDHRERKKRAAPAVTLMPLQGGFFVNAGGRF